MRVLRGQNCEFVPASHEDPLNPGVYKKVLAVKGELFLGRVQMINWARLPRGSSFRAHFHEDMEEVFIIIAGEVEITVANEMLTLRAGDTVFIEPREIHEMRNIGSCDAEYIVVGISGDKNGKTVVI